MDTITRFAASLEQARNLREELNRAIRKVEDGDTTRYVRVVLQQVEDNGPWGLTIAVSPEGD